MLELGLYLGTILLIVVAVVLVVKIYRDYKQAHAERAKIEWAGAQLEHALVQIRSKDDDTVLVGLQTIDALNKLGLPLEALPALADLLEDRSPIVKQYAHVTIKRLSTSGEFSRKSPSPRDDETKTESESDH